MRRKVFFVSYTWLLKSVLSCFILFFSSNVWAQADLPNPPSNVQSIAAGSFVIPMDTVHQSIVPDGQAPFNLKAYGLINQFLQNGIPVKWAIASGKEKDDIDFTATVREISPGTSVASSIDFRGGPFIVKDTSLPCGLSTTQIINAFGNNVTVYEATADFTADIRYTLTHRPKIAVFNNGGNEQIHARILEAAGIGDYDIMDAADIGDLINCYTFVSEPHADTDQVSQEVIDGVKAFVLNGGNFLAQCHAVETYENKGFFHTTSGIEIINTDVSHTYPNADLSYSQIHGTVAENNGGSVVNWTLAEGSQWLSYTYPSVQYNQTDTVIAMGAKLTDSGLPGGNVYYLGGHDYSKGKGKPSNNTAADLSTLAKVNALRLYLNAALVPSGNSNGAWANAGDPSLTVGCSDSVMLGCTLTGPPGSSFLWTPSKGLSCTDCPNPMARPEETTTYRVEVTNGCVATDSVEVIVGSSPITLFSNTTVCKGLETEFTDESTQSTFWRWDFGDPESGEENTSALQNPSHIFSTDGEFDVRLISGADSLCNDTLIKKVQVNPAPELKVNAPIICAGEEVTLTAEGADSYLWSNGESTASITITTTADTTLSVSGTEITNGCSADTATTVTIAPAINASVEAKGVSCFGENDGSAEAIIPDNNTYTYSWNTTPEQTTKSAVGLAAGNYRVIITDTIGCADTVFVDIIDPTYPVADFSFTNGCEGESIVFTDQSSVSSEDLSIVSWSWDFGNTTLAEDTSDQQNPTFSYDSAGIFNTRLLVTSTNGCLDSIVKPIEIYPIPEVYFGPKQEGCKPVCVSFKDSSTIASGSINKWFWDFGDSQNPGNTSSSSNPLYCYKETGSFSVSLKVVSEKGCSAIKSIKDMVTVYPEPEVDLGEDKVICPEDENNSPPIFNAGPAIKYSWQPTGETNQQIVAREPGTYTVQVTNEWGCVNEASVQVEEVCPPRLYVPNAFSPDKDGINDVYKIQSVNVGKYQLLIFNRWGEIIFESQDKNYHWDGMYKGKPMPIGVYPWIIIYEGEEEPYLNEYKKEGSVTVVR